MASTSGTSSNSKRFKCQCILESEFLNTPTIRCDRCKFYEHIVCLGYRELKSLPRPHYCFNCKLAAGMERDELMEGLNHIERQLFCGIRMYLYAKMTRQTRHWVNGMPPKYAIELQFYLMSRGFSLKNTVADALLAASLYPSHFYFEERP